eukprot:scaffold1659_cov255-Pinguiococcus_pyrenoidosus.AAC.55
MSSSDLPADRPVEDWEQSDLEEYTESVAERTFGFGVALALLFYVFITLTCLKQCCCTRWKEPNRLSTDGAKMGFTVMMAVATGAMFVTLIPIGIGAGSIVEAGETIIFRTAELMTDMDEQLLCGNGDAEVGAFRTQACQNGTLGRYLQGIHYSIVEALDTTIDGMNDIEANLTSALDDVQDDVDDAVVILNDMETSAQAVDADAATISAELDALSNPDNTEQTDFGTYLPDASSLPDTSTFSADVQSGLGGADEAVDSVDAAIQAVDDITGSEFDTIRNDYGPGGDTREEILGVLDDLFDELLSAASNVVDLEDDIHEVGTTYETHTGQVKWAAVLIFGVAPLLASVGFVFAYACGRGKFSSFMSFNVWAYLFGLYLCVFMGIFGVVTVILNDTCENDFVLMETNLDTEFEVGNTSVVVSDVVQGILTCPPKPDPPVATTDNNLVDILGLQDEFNFTSDFADFDEDFEESKTEILALSGDVDEARDSLELADGAIETDARQGYDPTSITSPMTTFRDTVLPPYPLDRLNDTQKAQLVAVYPNSPTLEDATTSGDASDFFVEFQVALDNVNSELSSMVVIPAGYDSSYTLQTIGSFDAAVLDNEFWKDVLAPLGQADAGVGPNYATYGSASGYADLLAAVQAVQVYEVALDAVEETNNDAKTNATQIIDAANSLDGHISDIETQQQQLNATLRSANASLNTIDNGEGEGLLYDSVSLASPHDTSIKDDRS